jgi:hypothetical protein
MRLAVSRGSELRIAHSTSIESRVFEEAYEIVGDTGSFDQDADLAVQSGIRRIGRQPIQTTDSQRVIIPSEHLCVDTGLVYGPYGEAFFGKFPDEVRAMRLA